MFADGAARPLLTANSQVREGQLVPLQALASANIGEVEDSEGKAGEAAHV